MSFLNKYYVYQWVNDDWGGVPVYVGQGTGKRASQKTGRSKAFLNHINRWQCHSEIILNGLSQHFAIKLESAIKNDLISKGYPILDAEPKYRKTVGQAEGIAAMPVVDGRRVSAKTGRGFGRPKIEIDRERLENLAQKQKDGLMTVADCCRELGISKATWYEKLKEVA